MNRKTYVIVGSIVLALGLLVLWLLVFGGSKPAPQPAPAPTVVEKIVEAPRPVSDIACNHTYQLDHLERFYVGDRVAVNFYFGGTDRNLQPQYIWDRNVIGMPTEIRNQRRVDRSMTYSLVTFLCQSDPTLEGQKISNVEVTRYRLTLRRPLVPQRIIRTGGVVRNGPAR